MMNRETDLFAELSPKERKLLERTSQGLSLQEGDFLFRAGEPVKGIFRIFRGTVKITHPAGSGKTLALRFAVAGGCAGHRSIFTSDNYRGSALAKEKVEASFVPTETLLKLFGSNRAFAFSLIRQIARDLDRTEQKLLEHQELSLASRLILLFRGLDEQVGFDDGSWRSLSIRLTKVELAELVGASLEAVVRQLSCWKKKSLLREEGKRISISPELLGRVTREIGSVGQHGLDHDGAAAAQEIEALSQHGPKLARRRSAEAQS